MNNNINKKNNNNNKNSINAEVTKRMSTIKQKQFSIDPDTDLVIVCNEAIIPKDSGNESGISTATLVSEKQSESVQSNENPKTEV